MRSKLPLGRLPTGCDYRDDAQLLPELRDGANDGGLGDFASQGLLQVGDVVVATFQLLVDMHCELRNLAGSRQLRAAPPIAIAAERVHMGRPNPLPRNRAIGGLPSAVSLTATPSFSSRTRRSSALRYGFGVRGRFRPSSDGFNKRRCDGRGRLPPWQKRQSPVSSIHVRASSKVRVPRPFWRIRSERACTNCSDVKEKPHFRVGISAF